MDSGLAGPDDDLSHACELVVTVPFASRHQTLYTLSVTNVFKHDSNRVTLVSSYSCCTIKWGKPLSEYSVFNEALHAITTYRII